MAERQHRSGRHDADRLELAGVTQQIATTEAAIERYLIAFKNGTLDDETAGNASGT